MQRLSESKIPDSIEATTLRPKMKEFKEFASYISKIETKQNLSFVKVVPPPKYFSGSKTLAKNYKFNSVVCQSTQKIGDGFEISYEKKTKMTFEQFEDITRRQVYDLSLKSISDWEDAFWASLSRKEEHLYATENSISLFDDNCEYWNLNKFTQTESLIHGKGQKMRGITDPYVYVGGPLTAFGMHAEDGNLNSINFMHAGAIKLWYFVPEEENLKLENLINNLGKLKYNCTFYIRHKCVLIPPSVLQQHGIKFTRVIQKPGEFVISFSGGYHQGFNLGNNFAEAVNFGSQRWLNFVHKFAMCECQTKRKKDDRFTLAQLKKIADSHMSHSIHDTEDIRDNQFNCCDCDRSFATTKSLRKHQHLKHSRTCTKFKCPICQSLCGQAHTLKEHFQAVHNEEKSIDFAKSHAIEVPMSDHNDDGEAKPKIKLEKLECDHCGVICSGKSNLKRHITNQHNETKTRPLFSASEQTQSDVVDMLPEYEEPLNAQIEEDVTERIQDQSHEMKCVEKNIGIAF